MDKEHWIKLSQACWAAKYLLPKDKAHDIYEMLFHKQDPSITPWLHIYEKYNNREFIISILNNSNEAMELLKDPAYDLKEWE